MDTRLRSDHVRFLQGFGRAGGADSYKICPKSSIDIANLFMVGAREGRPIVLRGAGRSYGDPAILPEAIAVSLEEMDLLSGIEDGIMTIQGGATIEKIWRASLPLGWWLPVVSGTAFPTIAGALAANIHGKNAFRAGTLGEHVDSMEVVFPSGEIREVVPDDEEFWAIIGGFGLLGVITNVRLRMHRLRSPNLIVGAEVAPNIRDSIELFERHEAEADYMVGWLDLPGGGRSIFHHAKYETTERAFEREYLPEKGRLAANLWRVMRVFNNQRGVKFVNWAKYRASMLTENGKFHEQDLPSFQFLLDSVPNWSKVYDAFVQFQPFVPADRAAEVFEELLAIQRSYRTYAHLAVMKKHRESPHLLNYSVNGFSLAMDFPFDPSARWREMMTLMIETVLGAGGKFYGAKDQLLDGMQYEQSVETVRLNRFLALKRVHDPHNLLRNQFAERVGLIPGE